MISVEYVLAAPEFRPQRAVDRSAALDVKAYLPDGSIDSWERIRSQQELFTSKYPHGDIYINGKKVVEELSVDFLRQHEPELRFFALAPGELKIVSAGFKEGLSTDDR